MIRDDFCKKQSMSQSIKASFANLDKLQTLLFFMIAPPVDNPPLWDFKMSDKGSKTEKDKQKSDNSSSGASKNKKNQADGPT